MPDRAQRPLRRPEAPFAREVAARKAGGNKVRRELNCNIRRL